MSNHVNAYETTFILTPEVSDDNRNTFMDKLKGIIQAHGGEIIAVEDWGKRRLAYAIHKETRGYYTYLVYSGNNSLVAELERNLRINEQVIRFLSVKIQDDYDAAKFKRRPTVNVASPMVTANPVPGAVSAPATAAN